MSSSQQVVITGIGFVSPLGARLREFWKRLMNGHSGIGPLNRFDDRRFASRLTAEVDDADIKVNGGRYLHEIKRMDRFIRYAVSTADEALTDSRILDTEDALMNGGVFIGVGLGGLPHMENGIIRQETCGPRKIGPYLIPSLIPNMAASLIALRHEIQGSQYTIAGSCASGIQAIGQAMRDIREGRLVWALAGGTEAVVTPITFAGFEAMRALSIQNEAHATPRPFDSQRDGMIVGEGAATVVLESRSSAEARGVKIYAVLSGYATCSGSSHIALQSVNQTVNCMRLALSDAKLDASNIDCVYAQASGMRKGDEYELIALQELFGDHNGVPVVTSIKGHIGHSFGASGPLNLVAALCALSEQSVSPTLNCQTIDPRFSNLNVAVEPQPRSLRHCLLNAFGFGGINAGLIVSAYPQHETWRLR